MLKYFKQSPFCKKCLNLAVLKWFWTNKRKTRHHIHLNKLHCLFFCQQLLCQSPLQCGIFKAAVGFLLSHISQMSQIMWQSQATTDSGTHTCLVQLIFSLLMTLVPSFVKITIRDGGSTTLYSANTVYTFYTVQTALHCLNSSMYAYICHGSFI